MTLIRGAVALMLGIGLGWWGRSLGWWGCDLPQWLWPLPLLLLPWTPRLDRLRPDPQPLRWPTTAGFVAPQIGVRWGLRLALLLCLAAGALRLLATPYAGCWTAADLAQWNLPADAAFARTAPQVSLTGTVVNFPVARDRQTLILDVTQLESTQPGQADAPRAVHGRVRFTVEPEVHYRYGDLLQVTGRLVEPPIFADFSYRDYLARQGIYSQLQGVQVIDRQAAQGGMAWRRMLYAARLRGLHLVEQSLPEPYAALAAGMLLGIDDGIPDELYARFNATGTSHVLVISGANVALIAALLAALTRRWAGRWRVPLALGGIALYALLVGGEAAVLRAALMGGLVVVAVSLGRRSTALVGLAAACAALLLVNPLTLWDVGFQLSALATLGLVLFSTPILNRITRAWPRLRGAEDDAGQRAHLGLGGTLRGMLVDGGVMTLAATILTLPLVAYHFGRVSLLGLLVNLLIVPAQPLVLLSGTGALLIGMTGATWMAQPLLWVTWLGLLWTERLVSWAAGLPGASVQIGGYGLGALVVTYGLIGLVTRMARPSGPRFTLPQGWRNLGLHNLGWMTTPTGLGLLALPTLLVWAALLTQPDGRLHLYFLDVGQGDGILIVTPQGRQILIDGGVQRERLLTELGAVMPWWDRSLDVVLATHPDADHMGAQTVLAERFRVDRLVASPAMEADADAAAWRAALTAGGATPTTLARGGWLDLGAGVALWVLWPPATPITGAGASNENSLVTKLVYGDFEALLTGDAGIDSELAWLATGAPVEADLLKVGHHGSAGSTSRALVEAVDPAIAVIQVGAENRYGHPTQAVLDLLRGRTLLRTDQDGRIHIHSDGQQIWVESQYKRSR
jgi:competence protein ComEC